LVMNPVQQADTTQQQDGHPQQDQQCVKHSNSGATSPLQAPLQDGDPPGNDSKMISMEDHEDTVKRIHEGHEATVKRLQLEIERLNGLVNVAQEDTKETKHNLEESIDEVSSSLGKPQGNRKRPKTEPSASSNKHDVKWQTRFEELKQFQESHGHCNVPTSDEAYKELSKW
jgi:hypothetical protein